MYEDSDVIVRQGSTIFHRCPAKDLIKSYVQVRDRDLAVIQIEKKGHAFCDIFKHIQTKSLSYSHNVQTVTLARCKLTGNNVIASPLTSTDARLSTSPLYIDMDLRGDVTKVVNAESWMYTGNTVDGDCAALLLVNNNRIQSKIVGVHNAFDPYGCIAISVPLYREEVEEALSWFLPKLQYGLHEDLPMDNLAALNFDDGDNFTVVGCEKGRIPNSTNLS